jgi:hypothetical protein
VIINNLMRHAFRPLRALGSVASMIFGECDGHTSNATASTSRGSDSRSFAVTDSACRPGFGAPLSQYGTLELESLNALNWDGLEQTGWKLVCSTLQQRRASCE